MWNQAAGQIFTHRDPVLKNETQFEEVVTRATAEQQRMKGRYAPGRLHRGSAPAARPTWPPAAARARPPATPRAGPAAPTARAPAARLLQGLIDVTVRYVTGYNGCSSEYWLAENCWQPSASVKCVCNIPVPYLMTTGWQDPSVHARRCPQPAPGLGETESWGIKRLTRGDIRD